MTIHDNSLELVCLKEEEEEEEEKSLMTMLLLDDLIRNWMTNWVFYDDYLTLFLVLNFDNDWETFKHINPIITRQLSLLIIENCQTLIRGHNLSSRILLDVNFYITSCPHSSTYFSMQIYLIIVTL